MSSGTPPARYGAYGLELRGLVPATADLVADPPLSWPPWTVVYEPSAQRPPGDWSDELDADAALLAVGPGTARLDRREARTLLSFPDPPTAAELTHPYLSATGAVAARWRGEFPLHAGGVLVGDQVWGLLGDREAGKSTTVAACWQAAAPIMTDDLLIVRGRTALAGPRTLDLRKPTADQLRAGEPLGMVGLRPRWRIGLDQVPAEAPIGGFVVLAWGDRLDMSRMPLSERPAALLAAHAVLAPPSDPLMMLDLFTLPVWLLTRPRDLGGLEAMADLLLSTLAG